MNINVDISSGEVDIVYFDPKTKAFQIDRYKFEESDGNESSKTTIAESIARNLLRVFTNTFTDGKVHKKNHISVTCDSFKFAYLVNTIFRSLLASFKFESEYIFTFKPSTEENSHV